MGTISFGPSNGGISIEGGGGGVVTTTGNSGGIQLVDGTTNVGGTSVTSYQRAVMAGYTGTESDFYTDLADRMMGNTGSSSASTGMRVEGGDIRLTLGDGTRVTLTA